MPEGLTVPALLHDGGNDDDQDNDEAGSSGHGDSSVE